MQVIQLPQKLEYEIMIKEISILLIVFNLLFSVYEAIKISTV
jgi:hypothetical protein